MKILTYNLHFGGKKGDGSHWKKLLDEFAPDFVLAQETFDPKGCLHDEHFSQLGHSVIWRAVPAKWGSAVYATKHKLTEIIVPGFEGWVVGARVDEFTIGGQTPRPLMIFSIHTPSPGPYEQKVHEILNRIRELSDGSEILIGGDFNITTAYRHPTEGQKNTTGELTILRRLRTEFGLSNAWQSMQPNESLPQTLKWAGNKDVPYHCDGIFIPHSWLRYLELCEVITEGWREMSDHFPILATLKD